jgi:hypothetical protein
LTRLEQIIGGRRGGKVLAFAARAKRSTRLTGVCWRVFRSLTVEGTAA